MFDAVVVVDMFVSEIDLIFVGITDSVKGAAESDVEIGMDEDDGQSVVGLLNFDVAIDWILDAVLDVAELVVANFVGFVMVGKVSSAADLQTVVGD
ncbi:hypothetical protein WICMUC_004182 [Wickerhamomyces mucosus]|uniref:Uncharacterized protein n=1 Tax=Wickerhamomyces mucosus TaxID=1378264 RepID=A0A9P8PIR1_9ASCO|nr:hypothetical protein WICMUC_004182 [Wickerhamomyces mucosus]